MKTEVFQLRISKEEKNLYQRETKKRAMSLSVLIRQALKNEINRES